jgi:cysteine-rich repeat protein
MARHLPRSTRLACLMATTAALAGCHVPGCREGDQACMMLVETTSTIDTTGTLTTGEPTTSMDTSSSTVDVTLTDPDTTTAPGECGDGVLNGDEECDDGNAAQNDACLPTCEFARCGDGFTHVGTEQCDDGDDDDTDACTSNCTLARCGDGFVHPPEVCDAGKANSDMVYGGCGSNCQWGPGCGDGKINGPEGCDDKNTDPNDGCLVGCIEATSCKQILEVVPGLPSGNYRIWPTALGGGIDLNVYCDMETDGGGYTFLKVDTEIVNASDKGAKAAEAICKAYGMHLFVPRTAGHVASAYAVATGENVPPVGGGMVAKGAEYMAILAIYPGMVGATCEGKGLNSMDCPMWQAWDQQQFWVTDKAILGEPSEDHCLGCSMFYKWNLDGTLKSYTTVPFGEGASSYRFMCDVADKV